MLLCAATFTGCATGELLTQFTPPPTGALAISVHILSANVNGVQRMNPQKLTDSPTFNQVHQIHFLLPSTTALNYYIVLLLVLYLTI